MRTKLFIFLGFIMCCSPGYAQKTKICRAWITLTTGDRVNGAMSVANEYGLVILNWETQDTVAKLEGKEIKVLKFRRKGAIGRGAWIGALGGAATGVIIGLADGDDEPEGWWDFTMTAEEKALAGGIVLVIPGTFVGMIIGALPKRFVIKGDKESYLSQLPEIEQYILHPGDN
mgnify:CR=1 FL=1